MDQRVQDRLVQWELARENGQQLSAEELCADAPELTHVLAQHIEMLRASEWMLDDPIGLETASSPDDTDRVPEQTVEEFVKSLTDSGVIEPSRLSNVGERASQCTSVDELAKALVKDNLITDYQADMLIRHDNRPLMLDRYVILDTIGSGGMGVVYKALHRAMHRIVAIKVLPDHALDSPEKVARFQREIRSVARLSHPHVVSAYDAHEQDGIHFLVMEYIEGRNLHGIVCDDGPFSVEDALRLTDQVAAGLAAAHDVGMVHRDVKPSNIMVDGKGTAKLLDLGLTRTDSRKATRKQTDLTQEGSAMGTASYMSPEQAWDSKLVDARSDIYSLGCTLFYLLTGKAGFEKTSTVQTIVAHREEDAPKLSQFRDDVPKNVETVYERMVEKDPNDRYDSIEALRSDLDAITMGSAVSRSAKLSRSRSSRARLKALGLIFAGLFIAILLGCGLFFLRSGTLPQLSHREIAARALEMGGIVTIESAEGQQELVESSEIPDADFQVVGLELAAWEESNSVSPLLATDGLQRLSLAEYEDVDVRRIAAMKSLTDLELDSCRTTDEDARAISEMQQLTQLAIAYCELGDAGMSMLSHLPNMEDLDVSGTDVTGAGLQNLAAMKSLRRLVLSETLIQDDDLSLLPKNLNELHLAFCKIGDGAIAHILKQPALQVLDLDETRVTGEGVAQLQALKSLRNLDLSGLKMTPATVSNLNDLPALDTLTLVGVELDDPLLQAVIGLDKVRDLNLAYTEIGDDDLMKLLPMSQLEVLDVSNTKVTAEGVEQFGQKRPDVSLYLDEDSQ